MFSTKKAGPLSQDIRKIRKLYVESFPENERFSFGRMIKNEKGHYETIGFYKDGILLPVQEKNKLIVSTLWPDNREIVAKTNLSGTGNSFIL